MIDFKDYPSLERVMKFFLQISEIPRESGNREPIARYLKSFADERGLWCSVDGEHNVIIKKPATAGYGSAPTVILQGHTDMVLAENGECPHDPRVAGVMVYRDGDLLRAVGTTLGGDDGVALAYALAILDGDAECHPEIEALFTSDEEIGLLGAAGLDASELCGRMLINIDSDIEGIFTVGCAGGVRCDIRLPLDKCECRGREYTVRLDGLLGGHSGMEIDKGRENAIKLIAEAAAEVVKSTGALVSDIRGGCADNAIAASASVSLVSESDLTAEIDFAFTALCDKYRPRESGIAYSVSVGEAHGALSAESAAALLSLIGEVRSGVIKMSEEIKGLPETSENLGILTVADGAATLSLSVRSAKGSEKALAVAALRALADKYGATVDEHGAYPAWEYRSDSPLCELMCRVYEEEYGKSPEVVTIHAGLECGVISEKIEGLDCVSIGPDNFDIHTTEERLSLSSVSRVYEYLKKLLRAAGELKR
ncbi:MAG: beta-Ala-His dipeptidase [Clostridia bacterium]|nr:beta-Ala-His dipeptidase [Clostridia bacterium]